ncbi:hypothetical protein WR25_23368 [Diploscapter pachys]|uniref:Uncharacterized protein n=1 Tax=Diploscapter pachys TaxID=2018661 RepID=A0A2A2JY92_9BILA|nr:hypothetical protein WR25_23368 [Diploscapter pachys]
MTDDDDGVTTLPGGIFRKSVGSLALRCMNMKMRSCHSGMPTSASGFSVLRPIKKLVFIASRLRISVLPPTPKSAGTFGDSMKP